MQKNKIVNFFLVALMLSFSVNSSAALMYYTFSGDASGSIGGNSFTDESFSWTMVGETNDITGGGSIFRNDAISSTVSINGFGESTVLEAFNIFSNTDRNAVGFQSDTDRLDVWSSTFGSSYDLSTEILALADDAWTGQWGAGFSSTSGLFLFSSVSNVSFEASLTGPSSVSEPASIALLGLGILGLGFIRKSKQA